jgi:hypothetical protein
MNRYHVIIALLLGIILGQSLPVQNAEAQSASDTGNRIANSMEDISDTLKKIERKLK